MRGLAAGAAEQKFLPVAVAAAKLGLGVTELLDLVVTLFPGPEARSVKGKDLHGADVAVKGAANAPFCGQVFRTTIDHFAGRVDYVRVFAGTLRPRHRAGEPAHPHRGARRPTSTGPTGRRTPR